jgi:predicted RNase H-like HicB family nuclease
MMNCVKLTIELDREEDGRWIAEALEIPGVMCYGQTRDEAVSNTEQLAIEVIADRIAHHELPSSALSRFSFRMSNWRASKANPLRLAGLRIRVSRSR